MNSTTVDRSTYNVRWIQKLMKSPIIYANENTRANCGSERNAGQGGAKTNVRTETSGMRIIQINFILRDREYQNKNKKVHAIEAYSHTKRKWLNAYTGARM